VPELSRVRYRFEFWFETKIACKVAHASTSGSSTRRCSRSGFTCYGYVGVSAAYYLIHSMSGSADFDQRDLQAARNFGDAARANGVERIIYLGGLGGPGNRFSKHLRSRTKRGKRFRKRACPLLNFEPPLWWDRAVFSFEMIRYLTERVPVMICPRWVSPGATDRDR